HFDFGPSFIYKDRTVNEIIAQGFPVTLTYGSVSFVVAVIVGITLGVAAAIRHNSWLDYLAVGISIGAQVLPNFVMAPLLLLTFTWRSEEHTSELQSRENLVCRLLLEKKNILLINSKIE